MDGILHTASSHLCERISDAAALRTTATATSATIGPSSGGEHGIAHEGAAERPWPTMVGELLCTVSAWFRGQLE